MHFKLAFPTHPAHNASGFVAAVPSGSGAGVDTCGSKLPTALVIGEGRALPEELCTRVAIPIMSTTTGRSVMSQSGSELSITLKQATLKQATQQGSLSKRTGRTSSRRAKLERGMHTPGSTIRAPARRARIVVHPLDSLFRCLGKASHPRLALLLLAAPLLLLLRRLLLQPQHLLLGAAKGSREWEGVRSK